MPDADTLQHEPAGRRGRLCRCLASPWIVLIAVILGVGLASPALDNGLEGDDLYHRAVMVGSDRYSQYMAGPQGMFRFLSGDPQKTGELIDLGFLPWWTYPGVKAEFLQFLTVQTHLLDYWLWPDDPRWMHAHSLIWFALLISLASIFYRRMLGPTWMAGLAALLFAVEDAHGTPVGWICNRNILLAASFGIGCLIAHDAWRRSGRHRAFWAAVVLWTCSLLSKEAGIATSAYLFAYALCGEDSSRWRRFLSLVPYGLILVVWRSVRDALGYGVRDFGFYVDPITEPPRFVASLIERYPVFMLGQWGLPPSDISIVFPQLLGSPLWWSAVGLVVGLAVLFWPLLRRDRLARFFGTGMLLAGIPICATFPSDRLLMFVGLGAMGLLVRFWRFTFASAAKIDRPRSIFWRGPATVVALLLVLIHLVLAPLLLSGRAGNPVGPAWFNESLHIGLEFDSSIEDQDLIVLNAPSAMHAAYYPMLCEYDGKPVPRTLRTLAPGISSLNIDRPDERTLVISPRAGYMAFFLDRLFRNEDHPMQVGQEVILSGMTVEVLSMTDDGRPASAAFRFDRPLEDPSLRWIRWRQGRFEAYVPPGIGEQITLESDWPPPEELFTRRGPPENWISRRRPAR